MLEEQRLSRKGVRKALLGVVGGTALVFFFFLAVDLQICAALKSRLKIPFRGKFRPVLFSPSFYLQDAQLAWKEKVKLISGDLKVSYHLWPLFENTLRVELEGKNLDVEFLQDWAAAQGVKKIRLESFYADLGVGREGLKEVYAVDARSPSFQFRIQRTENKRAAVSRGEKS